VPQWSSESTFPSISHESKLLDTNVKEAVVEIVHREDDYDVKMVDAKDKQEIIEAKEDVQETKERVTKQGRL
jgi:hypothetical protein